MNRTRIIEEIVVVITALMLLSCTNTTPIAPGPQQETSVEKNLTLRYYDTLTDLQPPENRLEIELLEQPGSFPLAEAWVRASGDTLGADSEGLFIDSSAFAYRPGDSIRLDLSVADGDTLRYRSKLPELPLEDLQTLYDLRPGLDTLSLRWAEMPALQYLWITIAEQKTKSVVHSQYVEGPEGVWSFALPEQWWGTFRLRLEFNLELPDEEEFFDRASAVYTYERRLDVYP